MPATTDLGKAAQRAFDSLREYRVRIALAESCTGGLVAASLAAFPGASDWLCGSAVTYRERTKSDWLGVSTETLLQHTAVSREATEAMAAGLWQRTPEAHVAVAVTGHLGPSAPSELDAVVFVTVLGPAPRASDAAAPEPVTTRVQLRQHERQARQAEAAACVLRLIAERLDQQSPSS